MLDFIPENRRPLAKAALVLLAVIILAAGYKLLPAATGPAAAPAPVSEPVAQDVSAPQPAIIRPGSVENPTALPVKSEFTGLVGELYVLDGQAVKAGQPLFRLEPPPAGGDAAVRQRPVTPAAGQDSYQAALNEYNRAQKLYELGAIPRRQLETAAARLQAAKDGEKAGQGTAAAIQAPVTVTAPVDGTVTGLTLTAGTLLPAGQQVMALGSGQAAEIVVPLRQDDLYLVPLGAKVVIEAAGTTITGQVFSIFPEVRQNQVASFLVHIRFVDSPPPGLLKQGMAVNVRFRQTTE